MLTIDDETAIEVRSMRPLTRYRLSVGAMLALGWSLALSAHAATPLTESCPVDVYPGADWKSVEPAGAGWSREKLNAAREYSASIHSSSVMILEHGVVIDEWGDVAKKISSYSVRKSLISALYGIYSAERVIDINQTLQQLGIDDAPDTLTAQEKQARVVDLLRARSGVYHLVDFEVHFPGVTVPPGTYSARGAGGHYLVVIPALDLVVVHRFDNDPPRRDAATVTEWADHGIGKTEFGRLLKLILEAKLH
jgi:CubicO group peptidase (beta-lactamase class C family)